MRTFEEGGRRQRQRQPARCAPALFSSLLDRGEDALEAADPVGQGLVREGIGIVVPAQTFFGPVAFLAYRWLSRRTPERSMGEWFKLQDEAGRLPAGMRRRARPAAEPEPVS